MSIHARGIDPHEPLDAVLRAATVPGHLEELAGEERAMAAFRAAVPAPRRRSLLARVLTVKVLVVGTVATSTGVVLATAGGVLPILPEPTPGPAPDPPAATVPESASVPSPEMDDTEAPVTPRVTSTPPPVTGEWPEQGKPVDPPRPDNDGRDRDDRQHDKAPSSGPPPEDTEEKTETSGPPSSRTETPGSPAHGAVTAVPPNGAVPPSQGG